MGEFGCIQIRVQALVAPTGIFLKSVFCDQYRFLWTAIRGFISEFGLYFNGEYFRLKQALTKH